MRVMSIFVLQLGFALWSTFLTRCKALYFARACHGSIILGDHLYIDGGEITTWNGSGSGVQDGYGVQSVENCAESYPHGGTCAGNISFAPNNFTYSIDLTSPWNNQTVELVQIKKAVPTLNYAALWLDDTGKSFYSYGGEMSIFQIWLGQPTAPALAVYQFHPSGAHGYWSTVSMSPQSDFGSLYRTSQFANTAYDGVGFALGGTQNSATSRSIAWLTGWYDEGLVTWNSSSGQWHNFSSQGYSNQAPGNGIAHFVPSFGPSGLLFFIGGIIYDRGTTSQTNVVNSQVYIYEPISQRWAAQSTSGTPPPGFRDGCIVGAPGENGTYEMFLFGGIEYFNNGNNFEFDVKSTIEELGSVHVLSLPAFHWQKMSSKPDIGRHLHTCEAIGRQMIVVGGQVLNAADYHANKEYNYVASPDPWANGIGVFDLNEMEWRDNFDPEAGPYKTPKMVSDYYASNSAYPPAWDDPVIKDWFEGTSKSATGSASNSGGSNSSGSNTGAIAGGVVGGIAGIALIAAGAFWLMKRSRPQREQQVSDEKAATWQKAELSGDPASSKPSKTSEVFESGGESRSEAPMSSRVAEVGGGGPWRYELPGHTAELPEGRDE